MSTALNEAILAQPPLVVDLDGTLLKTDLLIESILELLRKQPFYLLLFPVWMLHGKAWFKQRIGSQVSLDFASLPWRIDFIKELGRQRGEGRSIVLATAADGHLAGQAADYLKLFDTVLASDGVINLCGDAKRDALVDRFGERGFDYAADGGGVGQPDMAVWASARKAIHVGPDTGRLRDRLKALRPPHWLKNLLIFVPLIAAHRLHDISLLGKCLLAFVAFSCCASGGYLLNDLIDLDSDRRHPEKRRRPFAAGDLPLSYALSAIPTLLLAASVLAAFVSGPLLVAVLLYFGMSAGYSIYLKKIAVLDVLFLAGLYTARILAGSAATGIWPSHWLLAFSTFLFFSLALVKRYSELVIIRRVEGSAAKARGYEAGDGELLAAMGIASGYLAVLVLALYIATDKAQALYARPELLWSLSPLLLYWISYVWLTAHRGRMPGDPVVFATGDRTSRILILLMLGAAAFAL
jgi:4-hydroxybenzoate polyprenyltransferase